MKSYLPQLRESTVIKGAYMRWEPYRNEVTQFVLSHIEEDDQSLMILGAGACNDLDLDELIMEFETITLVDYCESAMKEAVERCRVNSGQAAADRIRVVVYDFWEIKEAEYEELERLFQEQQSVDRIRLQLNQIADRIHQKPLHLPIPYEATGIMLGIHSQLNALLAALFYLYSQGYTKEECEAITRMISRMNDRAVQRLNEAVYAKMHRVFFGYEYASFLQENGTYGAIQKVKACFEEGRAPEVGHYHLSRVEGAYQAEQDLSRRYHSGQIGIGAWTCLIWPFLKEKQYLVQLYMTER